MSLAEYLEQEKRRYSKLRCPFTRDFCHNESCPLWDSVDFGCIIVNGMFVLCKGKR